MKRFKHMLNSGRVKMAPSLTKVKKPAAASELKPMVSSELKPVVKDNSVRLAFQEFASKDRFTKRDVDKLIKSMADGPGLSKTETKDLRKILAEHEEKFTQGALDALQAFVD